MSVSDELRIAYVDTEGWFFDKSTAGPFYNDPRQIQLESRTLDPLACFSVLQFGAIILPSVPGKGPIDCCRALATKPT